MFRKNTVIMRKIGYLLLSLGILLPAGGCTGAPSVISSASQNAQAITQLIYWVFGIAAVVFVLVEGTMLFTYFRFKQKPGSEAGLPSQNEGNRRLEIAWTIVPAIILAVVFVFSIGTLSIVTNQPGLFSGTANNSPVSVRVVGHQWFWEIDYADKKVITANEMHIPVGIPVKIDLESVDVIHSFWVPQLGGKTDAIPGHPNIIWIQANQAGTYIGQCAEFCGVEHAKMLLTVIADPPEQFNAWLQGQQAPIPANLSAEAANGEQIFLLESCVGCHAIKGTPANGTLGPNLTHFASRKTFVGATLPNDADHLRLWLTDPQGVKPGNLMPNIILTDRDIQLLVAFLDSLK